MTASDVLHEGVTSDDHAGGVVAFESAHGSEPGLSRPWSHSIRLFAYCSVLWHAVGMRSSITARNARAGSVTISVGSPWAGSAVSKNRRAVLVSRHAET